MDRLQTNYVDTARKKLYERTAKQVNFLGAIVSPQSLANLGNCGIDGGVPLNGMLIFCTDAKSVQDGATAGSIAVAGGTGCYLQRANNKWLVM